MEKVIVLSASANKLANLKKQASEYAALIMEELDPDHQGYIEVFKSARTPFLHVLVVIGDLGV